MPEGYERRVPRVERAAPLLPRSHRPLREMGLRRKRGLSEATRFPERSQFSSEVKTGRKFAPSSGLPPRKPARSLPAMS